MNIIGSNAGIVWSALNINNKVMTFNEIKKFTKLFDFDLYTAIGWLAREGKVEINNEVVTLI